VSDTPAKKKITERQEAFLEALCGEARGDIRAAMRIAGYSDATKIAEAVAPIRDEIVERASMMIAMNAPKATFSMVDVLNDPSAMGARNAVSAASQILDRAGLVKKEQVEVKGPEGGIFILPPKQIEPEYDNGNDPE
jgi:alpha-mannosidase